MKSIRFSIKVKEKKICNVSVYPRMTAVQLPGNWFELADERCCYAMAC